MKVADLSKKYKNKWILAKVLKEDEMNRLLEVEPIAVSANRDKVYKALGKVKKGEHVATIYTGEFPKKDMTYIFISHESTKI